MNKLIEHPYVNILSNSILKNLSSIGIITVVWYYYNKYKYKKNKVATFLLSLPIISKKISDKLVEQSYQLQESLKTNYTNFNYLPNDKINKKELINRLSLIPKINKNFISGIIYSDNEIDDDILYFYNKYSRSNPLHPDIYPEIRMMEIDVINVCKFLYKNQDGCGNITSGGTESILLSCLTYRDKCKQENNVSRPNIIGFNTIHPAFDKAGHYFNIEIIKVNNLVEMKRKINQNTICIVGSAPEYSYGLIDPIKEMNDLAISYKTNFHIDACMGGFLIPFISKFNYINFSLEGVTSISLDTHKYGYSPKGSSVLLFKNPTFKKYQHFINKDWCGGVYATPTILGSKSGGIIAATWASIFLRGFNNYKTISNEIVDNLELIKNEIIQNNDIDIIGEPNLNIIAIKSNSLNIYSIANEMKKKSWNLSIMQNPPSFHFCITNNHNKDICKKFSSDLLDSCKIVKESKESKLEGTLALYGCSSNLESSLFIEEIIQDYIFLLSQNNISYRYNLI